MVTCIDHNLSPSYCYKHFKCRCKACIMWKRNICNKSEDKIKAKARIKLWQQNNKEKCILICKNCHYEEHEKMYESKKV
jgi:hypothetical protein